MTATPSSGQAATETRALRREVVNIGKSVVIKGELSGSEDLTIEGKVDGEIELREHVLTIGPNGQIKAHIFAKSVIVMGHVVGDITASDKINIRENGHVEGDINAPTVAISEGAQFRGSIDMQRPKAAQPRATVADAKPAATPSPDTQRLGGPKPTAATPTPARAAR